MASVVAASYRLVNDDIPGASLKGRIPDDLTVPELKRWLACRGARRKGNKPELVHRKNLIFLCRATTDGNIIYLLFCVPIFLSSVVE